jgi:hypothetical protein
VSTFIGLVLVVGVLLAVLMALSEAARNGDLKAAWANRARGWRRLKRSAGTYLYLVLAIHEITSYADPSLSSALPRWLRIPMGVAFLSWSIRRIAEDVINSATVEVTITREKP